MSRAGRHDKIVAEGYERSNARGWGSEGRGISSYDMRTRPRQQDQGPDSLGRATQTEWGQSITSPSSGLEAVDCAASCACTPPSSSFSSAATCSFKD